MTMSYDDKGDRDYNNHSDDCTIIHSGVTITIKVMIIKVVTIDGDGVARVVVMLVIMSVIIIMS